MLPQSLITPNGDECGEFVRVDELVYQHPEYQGQENVVGNDPMAVEIIATTIASAMRNTDKDFNIERDIKLGAHKHG